MEQTANDLEERARRAVGEPDGVLNTINDIMSTYVDAMDGISETYTIAFPNPSSPKEPLITHWRRSKTLRDVKAFRTQFAEFWLLLDDHKQTPKPWRDVLQAQNMWPIEMDEAISAYMFVYYSNEPTKINQIQAFQLLRNPTLTEEVITRIDKENSLLVGTATLQRMKNAKKKLKQIGYIDLD